MKKMHAVAGSTDYRHVGAMSADSENRLRGKEMDRERGVRTLGPATAAPLYTL